MKRLLVYILSLFSLSMIDNRVSDSPQTNVLSMESELDWKEVDEFLKSQIVRRPTLAVGLKEIKQLIKKHELSIYLNSIDPNRLSLDFNEFLHKTLAATPMQGEVKAIHFGIYTMIDKGDEHITFYLSGSDITPIEDSTDWNVGLVYFPMRYCILKDFDLLHKSYPSLNGNQEVLIYNGIINLLIMNSLQLHASSLLTYRNSLYVGSGFDSGDTYLLGQFSKEAFN